VGAGSTTSISPNQELKCHCRNGLTTHALTRVGAVFAKAQRTLTITKAGTGGGSIACDGGACAGSYPDGTTATLTATFEKKPAEAAAARTREHSPEEGVKVTDPQVKKN
jgi:hypothetical protein